VQLAAEGAVDAARTQLDLAARRYPLLEATWDLARADAHLRRYGIRLGSSAAFHVSSILTKLDLLARVELAAAVARREARWTR
jgi:hypothetical protein